MPLVVAIEPGFWGGSHRRVGSVFEVDQATYDRETSRPVGDESWMIPATPESLARVERMKAAQEKKMLAAAIVSSGSQYNKRQTFIDVMNAGRGPQMVGGEKAAAAAVASSGSGTAKAKGKAYQEARDAGRGPQQPVQ